MRRSKFSNNFKRHLYAIKYSHMFIYCLLVVFLSACSTRFEPAPVVSLSTKTASTQNLSEISGNTYTVEAGDTLFAVAFYSGNDYRELAKLNNIPHPYNINIGQTIILEPPTSNSVLSRNNISPSVEKTTKLTIDPVKPQEYGVNRKMNHRKTSKKSTLASNEPYNNLNWSWPANGNSTIATVGSDGSKRGLDIKGKIGSSIVAAASGKVVYAGNALKGYGNLVIIKHKNDYLSAYAHNNSILVSEQTNVKQGQQIATMGNTGASDIMLHFEIRKKGKSVDPFKYLPAQ